MNKLTTLMMLLMAVTLSVASVMATTTITNVKFTPTTTGTNNQGLMTFTIQNTGTTYESGLVEMAFYPATLSVVSSQFACNPSFPWNVHKGYGLAPGESANIQLQANNIPQGSYKVVITHADKCCTDGVNNYACSAKQPYGFESTVATVSYGNPVANVADQCDTDYQAGVYLQNKGTLNCAVPTCNNPSGSTSTATCATPGVCNTGSYQAQNCPDGTVLNVRYCENANWKATGYVCAAAPTPSEPNPLSSVSTLWNNINKTYLIAIVAGVAGLILILRKR